MPSTESLKVEYRYRNSWKSWGFWIGPPPKETVSKGVLLRYRTYEYLHSDGRIYNTEESANAWTWCHTEKGAIRKSQRWLEKRAKYLEEVERVENINRELKANSTVVNPGNQVVPVPVSKTVPLVSSFSSTEQEKRLRFGKSLIARPEKYASGLDGSYGVGSVREPSDQYPANVLVSDMGDGTHAFCVDIDIPCELVQSRTPGHYHLYIDRLLPKEDYFELLDALAKAGIVEKNYVAACRDDGMTILRLPPGHDTFEKLRAELAEDPDWMTIK